MINRLLAVLALASLYACAPSASNEVVDRTLSDTAIQNLENGLHLELQIKGRPIEKFAIADRMEYHGVPNLSIAVIRDGQLVWAKGYGVADPETGQKVDSATLFQAASISKPVTAMGALRLVQEGKIELDTDVNQYLKDWKVPENRFTDIQPVTVRGLLTHTAGVTVHGFPGYAATDEFPTDTAVLNGRGNTAPIVVDTIPGSIKRYSGGGYTILERVIENVTGQSFADYMQETVLTPLEMERSTFAQPLPADQQDNVSVAYGYDEAVYEGRWHSYPEQAAAGLWTTPSDLAKFSIAVHEAYLGESETVINQEMARIMLEEHPLGGGHGPGLMGAGDSLAFMHGGKNEGFTCHFMTFANSGDGMIFMSGGDGAIPLISECQRSVASYFGWDYMQPREVETVTISESDMEKRVGKYLYRPRELEMELKLVDGEMVMVYHFMGGMERTLYPIDSSDTIDPVDATTYLFVEDENGDIEAVLEDGQVRIDKIE